MSNYRPIANFNTIGKTLERLAMNQLRRHLESTPNGAPLQSAYHAFHSTETAMTRVVCDLLTATDNKTPAVLLSLDISAAFDTPTIVAFWSTQGLCSVWMTACLGGGLKSYLTAWKHFVSAGGCRSRTVKISTGVPQRSVLGPLLFSIFATPVSTLISTFGIPYHQFADDMQLYTAIKSLLPSDLAAISYCADAVMG